MIIASLNSGLGNQMFQYAAGKSLARHLQSELLLDITWFKQSDRAQTPRSFELMVYPIKDKIAKEDVIDQLIRPSSHGIFNRIKHKINRSRPIHNQWSFIEPHFHFYSDFFKAKSPVHIEGYWQSEKYFQSISEEIRTLFSLEIPENDPSKKWVDLIHSQAQPVSIHVRRGDMVKNPEVAKIHGSCNLDYYQRAMSYVENKIKQPRYFVFSDDIDWCKEHLNSKFPIEFVSGNEGDRSYWDIQLMRHCKHNIIANSSFSWWGAWLNKTPNKIVLAPINWFNHTDSDTKDLIPNNWIRI
jgi:hypothetical protein